jgi:hypothetical protein
VKRQKPEDLNRAQRPLKTTEKRKESRRKQKNQRKWRRGTLVGARSSGKSLDPRGGETAVQGGGWGKGKGKRGAPGLGHQVNN